MITVSGTKVDISRGDTALLTLTFDGAVPGDGTVAVVTLKRNKADPDSLWEKRMTVADGSVTLSLTAQDTDQTPGPYWWDVRLFSGESVTTPLGPQILNILEVVGECRREE